MKILTKKNECRKNEEDTCKSKQAEKGKKNKSVKTKKSQYLMMQSEMKNNRTLLAFQRVD